MWFDVRLRHKVTGVYVRTNIMARDINVLFAKCKRLEPSYDVVDWETL